jgi:hypothetical protein
MTESESIRIEFSSDKSLFNDGDNYGAWLALSQVSDKERIVEQVEVFSTDSLLYEGRDNDLDFYNAGYVLLIEILMNAGWKISAKDNQGRVSGMRKAA